MSRIYPFSALVGQQMMITGLLLNAINPRIGGILIRGDKGTGKSTAVRALGAILPQIQVREGCPFSCGPDTPADACPHCSPLKGKDKPAFVQRQTMVVDLPINATEDRVAGTLDLEHALAKGQKRFEPGLLARANRGILYVDEVNLLDDHIVDILLDSAAMGVNSVEREGVSFSHPARFILVGTMNPEEGDLRPQLLDRFGLCVTVSGIEDLAWRDELVRRWEAFEDDPDKFAAKWNKADQTLKKRILQAMKLLPAVKADDSMIRKITGLSVQVGVDGHRADLVMLKAAKAHAALCARRKVMDEDVAVAAKLALFHRMKKRPFDDLPKNFDTMDKLLCQNRQDSGNKKKALNADCSNADKAKQTAKAKDFGFLTDDAAVFGRQGQAADDKEQNLQCLEPSIADKGPRPTKAPPQGRGFTRTNQSKPKKGRYIGSAIDEGNRDIAFDATLRAAAPFCLNRPKGLLALPILKQDWRAKIRSLKTGLLFVFVVDASGSMGSVLLQETRAAILKLLDRAYKDRAEVALVAFKARSAQILLQPTKNISNAEKKLRNLPFGGTTPLCAGISLGLDVAIKALSKGRIPWPKIVLVTDGKANVGMGKCAFSGESPLALHEEVFAAARSIKKEKRISSVVIDTEKKHPGSLDLARQIALHMGAKYVSMETLVPDSIVEAVTA
ncbi:MAG: ATP-binding protein [Desulfatibacillaceae bacterium]|nr:ATP-binding protein [Desulfatibacillaceae bacterium]